mmetsp:Transcript_10723/g.44326  ORF Transcript_10723/g.44326 Transcript_10723/m.44326 type:complete len:219 (+) Transcript_10723:212-868(+)
MVARRCWALSYAARRRLGTKRGWRSLPARSCRCFARCWWRAGNRAAHLLKRAPRCMQSSIAFKHNTGTSTPPVRSSRPLREVMFRRSGRRERRARARERMRAGRHPRPRATGTMRSSLLRWLPPLGPSRCLHLRRLLRTRSALHPPHTLCPRALQASAPAGVWTAATSAASAQSILRALIVARLRGRRAAARERPCLLWRRRRDIPPLWLRRLTSLLE